MQQPIVVRFASSPQLMYRANMAILRHTRWLRWTYVLLVVGFPLLLIGMQLVNGQSFVAAIRNNLAWIIGIPVFWLVGIPLILRRTTAKAFRTTPSARGDRTFTFGDDGIVVSGGLSTGTLAWAAVVRMVETRDLFLLFLNKQVAHFIPKAAFASPQEIDQFRELVVEKVPSRRQAST